MLEEGKTVIVCYRNSPVWNAMALLTHPNNLSRAQVETNPWYSAPRTAFDAFVLSPDFVSMGAGQYPTAVTIRLSSAAVYKDMFSRFLNWLDAEGEQPVSLIDVGPAAISRFLDVVDSSAASEIRWRYVRLLERVYEQVCAEGVIQENPVTAVIVGRMQTHGRRAVIGNDAPMACVSAESQAQLAKVLLTLAESESWKDQRDAALAAAFVGAGLKLSEALALQTSDVNETGAHLVLDISKGLGSGHRRQARMLDFAIPIFASWLRSRGENAVLFPGTKESLTAMDPATAYRRVRKVLETAGASPGHLGGRTLRNSYATKLLADGVPPSQVGKLLGLQEEKSIKRYLSAPGAR